MSLPAPARALLRPVLFFAAMMVLATAACSKKSDAPAREEQSEGPPLPTESEIERARDACRDFKKRVCAVADPSAERAEQCAQADARIEAIDALLKVALGEGEEREKNRRVAQAELRRVAKGCIEDAARLR